MSYCPHGVSLPGICRECAKEIKQYEVIVGNIGNVYLGNNPVEARKIYGEYKRQSIANYGRAAGEDVTLFCDHEIELQYWGTLDG